MRAVPSKLVYETETGWMTHNVFVSWDILHSPCGERWPVLLYPRLRSVLNEYGWICKLAETTFPVQFGYRSLRYQREFHLYHKSDHVNGFALDILPAQGWTVPRMAVYARQRWRMTDSVLWGIGQYPDWLHIDTRPRKSPCIWRASVGRPE